MLPSLCLKLQIGLFPVLPPPLNDFRARIVFEERLLCIMSSVLVGPLKQCHSRQQDISFSHGFYKRSKRLPKNVQTYTLCKQFCCLYNFYAFVVLAAIERPPILLEVVGYI